MTAHSFDIPQGDLFRFPNYLEAYRLAMIIPLPDIRESKGCVAQKFITQFYAGEDARFKEKGMGIKSEPQTPRGGLFAQR
jgi:hypothetical protein